MVFVVVNSALGVYAVIQESMGLILTNMIIHGISMLLEFIGAIVICIYGVEESDVLTKELNEVFLKLIYKWDEDPRASRILRQIFECCTIHQLVGQIQTQNCFSEFLSVCEI